MRILVFDTETTGLPKSKIISPDTLNQWPHIVQFSFVIYDTELNDIVVAIDNIVKLTDTGIVISEDSIKLHGITHKISQTKGVKLSKLLHMFCTYLKNVDVLVGHNVSFDINLVKIEILRLIYSSDISDDKIIKYKNNLHVLTNFTNVYCTMQNAIELCGIKLTDKFGKEYNKFPKLLELHQKLFNSVPNNLHNSFNDILITLRCYVKMNYGIDLNEVCDTFIEKTKNIRLL